MKRSIVQNGKSEEPNPSAPQERVQPSPPYSSLDTHCFLHISSALQLHPRVPVGPSICRSCILAFLALHYLSPPSPTPITFLQVQGGSPLRPPPPTQRWPRQSCGLMAASGWPGQQTLPATPQWGWGSQTASLAPSGFRRPATWARLFCPTARAFQVGRPASPSFFCLALLGQRSL